MSGTALIVSVLSTIAILASCLQDEIDEFTKTWNQHLIRPSTNARVPFGRPNIMYFMPELYDATDNLHQVTKDRIAVCKQECRFSKAIPCDTDIYELCCILMEENGQEFPQTPDAAVDLYLALRELVAELL